MVIGLYRFFFFSNEGNEPPHVHIESGDRYAKFWLNQVRLASGRGYNRKTLNMLQRMVQDNVTKFMEKWNAYFGKTI